MSGTVVRFVLGVNLCEKTSHESSRYHAEINGNEVIMKLLLARDGVDGKPQDNYGFTPLVLAAKNGHETVVKLPLEEYRVDSNCKDPTIEGVRSHGERKRDMIGL